MLWLRNSGYGFTSEAVNKWKLSIMSIIQLMLNYQTCLHTTTYHDGETHSLFVGDELSPVSREGFALSKASQVEKACRGKHGCNMPLFKKIIAPYLQARTCVLLVKTTVRLCLLDDGVYFQMFSGKQIPVLMSIILLVAPTIGTQ